MQIRQFPESERHRPAKACCPYRSLVGILLACILATCQDSDTTLGDMPFIVEIDGHCNEFLICVSGAAFPLEKFMTSGCINVARKEKSPELIRLARTSRPARIPPSNRATVVDPFPSKELCLCSGSILGWIACNCT